MSDYRVYSLSARRGHIIDVDQFNARSDVEAVLKVTIGEIGVARELWSLGRKVIDLLPRACPEDLAGNAG